jgi:hypothetical protein
MLRVINLDLYSANYFISNRKLNIEFLVEATTNIYSQTHLSAGPPGWTQVTTRGRDRRGSG